MKLNPVGKCTVDAIKYICSNFGALTVLILQIFALGILGPILINILFGIDPLEPNSISHLQGPLPYIFAFSFNTLLSFSIAFTMSLAISRQIVLDTTFEANFFKLIIQKRFWYALWANAKLSVFIGFIYSASLLVLGGISLLLYSLVGSPNLESTNIFQAIESSDIKLYLTPILIVVPLLVMYMAQACFLYVPLFAYIDKKASFVDAWKTTRGNRAWLFGLLLIVSFVPLAIFSLAKFFIVYVSSDFTSLNAIWITKVQDFLGIYFQAFVAAAIALSYQLIMNRKK